MEIPRPTGGSRQAAGVGKIFVKYDTPESAQKAMKSLAGRKFADRTVVVTYFGEVRYPRCVRMMGDADQVRLGLLRCQGLVVWTH